MQGEFPDRGTDDWGNGDFEAPRGHRKHKGIDLCCYPDTIIHSPIEGEITKLGYPYANALDFRYVEITDANKNRHRVFYVFPTVQEGDYISRYYPIGVSQDVARYYRKKDPNRLMKNHIHYEILDEKGTPINPKRYKL